MTEDEAHVPGPPRFLHPKALAAVRAWTDPNGGWLYRVWIVAQPGWTYPMAYPDAAACLEKAGYTRKSVDNTLAKARRRFHRWKASLP